MQTVKVLFVCLGNICRSPTAEGVFSSLLHKQGHSHWIKTDSAGTHAYHVGASPDKRAQIAARRRGVDISGLRGRKVSTSDFQSFDYILAMDYENLNNLLAVCPDQYRHKVQLFLSFARNSQGIEEVPDPYYGGDAGFEKVLDLVEDAAAGLLDYLLRNL